MNRKRENAKHVEEQAMVARSIARGVSDAIKGERQDYVIEVYRPAPTWLTEPSDEDEPGVLAVATDPEKAVRYTDHGEARRAVKEAVKNHPATSFRLGVLPPLPQQHHVASAAQGS
ncbi:hypothetical protein [Cupriavidus sp. UYPR2.512]|uniref:hypothetical protein n=1 Tax=Cupriavidus sp. UYPR2.512 TaxID=1080187 RepID=UPI000362B0BF|nr:hypothetical protein [Cupriavidus sp. UYPR2.512]UIF89411.1 hypothetical protein KAF44_29510 [Cupriavidus necator]